MSTYYASQELPGHEFTLYDHDGITVLPLASLWSGKVLLIAEGEPDHVVREQVENITLASTAPNLIRTSWAAATLTAVAAFMTSRAVTTIELLELPVIVRLSDSADEVFGRDHAVRHVFRAAPV